MGGRNHLLIIILSIRRDKIGVTEIGLQSLQTADCDTLGNGVTMEVCHVLGIHPTLMLQLIRCVTTTDATSTIHNVLYNPIPSHL